MLTLVLEPTDDRANPVFKNLPSCEKWLSKLQLTNLQLAHSQLLTEINELNCYAMRGADRMNILELLRDTVDYVQTEYIKKLAGKPLPLNEHELLIFISSIQLWQAMSQGYQRCLQAAISGDKQLAKHAALLCHRALLYSGRAIVHHLKTGYEFEGKLWQQLHSLYAYAESSEILTKKVADPQSNSSTKDTCHHVYMRTLLTSHAHPAELSQSQFQLLEKWLPGFIALLTVDRRYVGSKGDAQPLAFNLKGSQHGLRPARVNKHCEHTRYLSMVPISKDLRVKSILLEQGKTPKQVELGDDENGRDCLKLLKLLHQYWCEASDMRFIPREQNHQHAVLYHNFSDIHFQLSGSVIRKPVNRAEVRKQIETFGRELNNTQTDKSIESVSPDSWRLDNNSLQGAQLTLDGTSSIRLKRRQLVAVRPESEAEFILGIVAWIKVIRTGQIRIGVRYLPGEIEPVNLKATGSNKSGLDESGLAFLLKPLPNTNIPASLIIPKEWFKPERMVEVHPQNSEKMKVTFEFSIEHGSDFERVSYIPAIN